MTLWPFRRKDAHKRPRNGAALSDGQLPPAPSGPKPAMARAASKKKQRTESAKLQRRPRAYSFSPDRHDSIRIYQSEGTRMLTRRDGVEAGGDTTNCLASQPLPTLYHRSSQQPARKSSKRRREEHEREAEIKAMSAQTLTRLTLDARAAGYLSRRSSKRAKTTSVGSHWHKPPSNVSLPLFDSIDSSQSSDSECVSFKVSALDVLAPRPTLRCASASRRTPSRASAPTRAGSHKQSLIDRDVVPKDALDSRQRVDDLADGLDASDLRELLERDSRRRERKRQRDQERMDRRLNRRADRQRREEAEAKQSGMPLPQNLERGIMGRELVGLGIEPPSAVVTSSQKRESPTSDAMSGVEEVLPREPLETCHPTDAAPHQEHPLAAEASAVIPKVDTAEPPTEPDEPVSALPQTSILAGILRSKKSQSKSTPSSDREKTTGEEDHPRQDSDSINKPSRLSFISFLRQGGRKHRSPGPSTFLNKSREEMQAVTSAQAEALSRLQGDDITGQANYLASKPGAGAPRRTRSRFREDLPDYPLSPPDSRVQSPEAETTLYAVDEVKTPVTESRPASPVLEDQPPTSARSTEAFAHAPTTGEGFYGTGSCDPQLSTSLASIDSEGSWLSGRVGMRSAMRDGIARAKRRDRPVSDCPTSSTREDVVDDYLSRLTAGRRSGEIMMIDGPSGDGRPSSDEEPMEDVDVRWDSVGAGRPRVIQFHRHDRDTTRSREGLLNCYPDNNFDDEGRDSTMNDEAVDLEQTGADANVDSYGTH